MTAPDAPQVEPLKLTFEEALAKLGERGYTLAVYHHEDAPREYVLHDVFSAISRGSFDHWKDAAEAVLGVPVVPRDPAAELVEAVAKYVAAVEAHEAYLERTCEVRDAAEADEAVEQIGKRWGAMKAALARVKGGER